MNDDLFYENILITGNGFDLTFGLPTRYKDFLCVMDKVRNLLADKTQFANEDTLSKLNFDDILELKDKDHI